MKSLSLIVWVFLFSFAFGLQKTWADSQISYDGQWYGEIVCKGDDFNRIPAYTKTVSLEIKGSKVIISNFGDHTQGDSFSHEGSIELEGGFLSKAGNISINGGTSTLSGRTIEWYFGGKWDQKFVFLSGMRDGRDCTGTLKPGTSEQVEKIRPTAAEEKKQQSNEEGFGSIFGKLTTGISSGLSEIASEISGSAERKAEAEPKTEKASSTTIQESSKEAEAPTNQQTQNSDAANYGTILSSLTGGGGGSSGGGWSAIVGNIATSVTGEKAFSGRSALSVYIATTRFIHLATKRAGIGILKALEALGIKQDKDIPAYLNDIDAVEMPNAFTKQVQEREAEILEFASEASVEIKEKLSSGFSLSEEAKKSLAEAHKELKLAEIYQTKVLIGAALTAVKAASSDATTELNTFLNEAGVAMEEILNFFPNVRDLFSNFDDIVEVADTIEETESMKDVQLAEKEFLEEVADKEIEESVIADLEESAS